MSGDFWGSQEGCQGPSRPSGRNRGLPLRRRGGHKTIMKYHFSSVRMAAIQKSISNKCWRGCGEKGTLLHCWWEWKLVQPLWRTVWRFLRKLEIELPYDPAIPLMGIHTDETRIESWQIDGKTMETVTDFIFLGSKITADGT